MYNYKALIVRVVDADTFDAEVDVGFSIKVKHRFRVNNYDAPEIWRPKTDAERIHGEEAMITALRLLTGEVIMTTYKLDIYARYAADVTLPDGRDYATVMKHLGFEKQTYYEP